MRETAPRKSFIHVEEFESIAQLVDYIHYLDQNQTAYLEYHEVKPAHFLTINFIFETLEIRTKGFVDFQKKY